MISNSANIIVTMLVVSAAIPSNTDGNGTAELITAIRNNDVPAVDEFLNVRKIPLGFFYQGANALHYSCRNANAKMTKFLLENGAAGMVDGRNSKGFTPLDVALMADREDLVEVLTALVEIGKANTRRVQNKLKLAPLHLVRSKQAASYLIAHNADVNAVTTDGLTPAHYAISNGEFDVLRCLVEEGHVDLSIVGNDGTTVFHCVPTKKVAESGGNIWTREVVEFLVGNDACPLLNALDRFGETPVTKMMKADFHVDGKFPVFLEGGNPVFRNMEESFYNYMIANGAEVSKGNRFGDTLLHLAAGEHLPLVVKWLLKKGAKADATNRKGETALMAAVKDEALNGGLHGFLDPDVEDAKQLKEVIDALVENGASVDVKDEKGRPLMYYVQMNAFESVLPDVAVAIETKIKEIERRQRAMKKALKKQRSGEQK